MNVYFGLFFFVIILFNCLKKKLSLISFDIYTYIIFFFSECYQFTKFNQKVSNAYFLFLL